MTFTKRLSILTDDEPITPPINQHNREEDLPHGRTLFLANVPLRVGLDTAAYLREAFGRCGSCCLFETFHIVPIPPPFITLSPHNQSHRRL